MSQLQLFNTLTGKVEPFEPADQPAAQTQGRPARVKMYVCGPTVYDEAHLGHARCYITWDVLYRFLKFLGYEVTYVRNVTDVDDKILKKADELGISPDEVAQRYYESFSADMQALNVLTPDEEPHATRYIPQMIAAIQTLIEKGAAYVTPEGTVYYRVASKPDYGKLSKKPLEDLKAGARVDVDPHKESPLDFALWKHVPAEEQGKPGHAFDSPWGKGRPGWHIECSAMNAAVFESPQIDIHAGGADLIFPHHENEIAQSEAWTGCAPFAKYWLHNGFVNVSGEKMSKSLGNFATIKKVLERYDANTIRYFLLTNHYRMPVDFNDEALEAAENWAKKRSRKLKEACEKLNLDLEQLGGWLSRQVPQESVHARFAGFLADDLNSAKALVLLNELIAEVDIADSSGLAQQLANALTVFKTLGFNPGLLFAADSAQVELPEESIRNLYRELVSQTDGASEPEGSLQAIIDRRKQAKAEKNWAEADAIRNRLSEIGIQIMDNKDGTTTWELVRK